MLRGSLVRSIVPALLLVFISTVQAGDDPRFAADFVQGLRERGYYDLALEYLDQLRQAPDTPDDLKRTIDFEEGRTLIESATHASDPDASKEKLDQAKIKIESFVKANPDLPQTTEALVDLAHLLYERGLTEVDLAGDFRNGPEKENKLAGARGYYANAREAYSRAFERLNAKLETYPKFIPPDDPRKSERERVRNSLMQAELQRSVVDYYESQTFGAGSKERTDLLEKSLTTFDDIYKRYRVQLAGFTARMWQGKCYEELGKLGEAMGIYNELIDHPDPALRTLQKQVDYFRIIVMGKRKEYALAADECARWLNMFPNDRRSYNALGVQFELGKNIIAQLPGIAPADRDKAIRTATDRLADVVRVVSPFKSEAIELLQEYRPNAIISANDAAKLSYDEAMAQAEQAIAVLEYEKSCVLLEVAIRKTNPVRDATKVNKARFTLAYSLFMSKRFYEAAVIAEHVARNYPSYEWSPKAADLAMQAMVEAYNKYTFGDRASDLDRLVSLARYTSETWSESEQGDSGRLTLGLIALGRGQYSEAISAFESVRASSTRWNDAQASCGEAHWKQSLVLRDRGNGAGADAEVKLATEKYELALKSRREANAPNTDPGVVSNSCDLAIIKLETGKPADALAILEPIAKNLSTATRSASLTTSYSRVLAAILRAHVATNQTDLAIADMKLLESIGGGTDATLLYYELSKLLVREIEALKKRNDRAGMERTQQAFRKFLGALVDSKSGQSYESLLFAGDNLLKLGDSKQANEVFNRILDFYAKDPEFQKDPKANDRLLVVRIRQVAALRGEKKFSEAESKLEEIIAAHKRLLEPLMERGYLADARAEANELAWNKSYSYWRTLALRLNGMRPKPKEYFEAWYHAAVALQRQGNLALAKQTLASVMRLSPDLGDPEMKAKYQELAGKLGK
ncbi:tetratricopeptide repeat protein [Tundrisphaera lichenicola]|uniref:tetratricopeptide repeat protein n=1 Tax=Tundrisphaera lichenicola TaxID=2029860 RepID=UPI003EBFEAD4